MIAEISKKSNDAAEIFSVFNVDVRATVNTQFVGKFHLGQIQVITCKQETFSKVFAEFTEAGVVFGNLQGNPTSLSSKFLKILTKETISVEEVYTTFFH